MFSLTSPKAYLFDIDGVLTDPETKHVQQEEIFEQLTTKLQKGNPIGLNTGRSMEYIDDHVLRPLELRIPDKKLLENLFTIGEKGAIRITYNSYGEKAILINHDISIPQEIQEEIKHLVNESPYSDIMFYDDTKQTMITIELKPNKTVSEFQAPQKQLTEVLQQLLVHHGLQHLFRVDPTHIAIDIESVSVGKALGTRLFVQWLEEKNITPDEYVAFGDSLSDVDMYKELERLKKKALFVYVGDQKHFTNKSHEGIIFTQHQFDKGTLEFLQHED